MFKTKIHGGKIDQTYVLTTKNKTDWVQNIFN